MNPFLIYEPQAVPNWDECDERVTTINLGQLDAEKRLKMTLPDDLAARFPEVTHLRLWSLDVKELPALPPKLKVLEVRKCPHLNALPPLPEGLEVLDLGGCEGLAQLPAQFPRRLKELYLDGCTVLKSFKPARGSLGTLARLELHGCRFDDLDERLCGEQRENVIEKVLAHFGALAAQGVAAVAECKLVVLGNGGVGKTSLVRVLKGLPQPDRSDPTEGIQLWRWDARGYEPFVGVPAEVNIWDFGGQDLYHNTHRMFLDSRAVFVVVWRQPRADGKPLRPEFPHDPARPLNYWLDQIFTVNPKAEVIVVRMGKDEDDKHPPSEWRREVREEYRTLPEVSLSKLVRNDEEVDKLVQWIQKAVKTELRSLAAISMGAGRKAVREHLKQWQPETDNAPGVVMKSTRPVLRLHEFRQLVRTTYAAEGFATVPAETEVTYLLDYLHFSGAVYCPPTWRTESALGDAYPIIVDQRWAVDAIYEPFRPSSEGALTLKETNGQTSAQELNEEVWGDRRDSTGSPLYTPDEQWVLRRFMLSCGVMVPFGDDEFILPELLPRRASMERLPYADPLVRETAKPGAGRAYYLRHRSLGQGFGCLLVAMLPGIFGKCPLFRYGGIGRIAVLAASTHQGGHEVPVRIEWFKETDNAYHGDIIVTVFGSSDADDAAVLSHVHGELAKIAGFPEAVSFELQHGPLPANLERRLRQFRLAERGEMLQREALPMITRSVPRLGVVGLSVAGADVANPGIELFPQALEACLNAKADRTYDVLYYHSDTERKTTSRLIGDLVKSDLMVAFIGRKYLHSDYCMVEFLCAARHYQPERTFTQPEQWPHRLFAITMPDADELVARTDKKETDASNDWCDRWLDRGADYVRATIKEFRSDVVAREKAPLKYVFDAWMRFAVDGIPALSSVLAALKTARHVWTPTPVPAATSDPDTWARQDIQPLADEIHEKMCRLTAQLTGPEREERLRQCCVRHWSELHAEEAADLFDQWITSHNDAAAKRRELLERPPSEPELSPIWDKWRDRQRPARR